MVDLLGPASAPFAKTVRPAESRVFGGSDTWFGDCTSESARDGTRLQAALMNGLIAQLRVAIRSAGITEDNADDAMLYKAIQAIAALSAGVPIGGILLWPSTTLPSGFGKINGALLSRTTYATLFALAQASGRYVTEANWQNSATFMTASFSDGDGSTSFRLPDFRGEFFRALDDGRGVDISRNIQLRQKATGIGTTGDATNSDVGVGTNYANQVKQGDGIDGSYVNGIGSSGSTMTFNFQTVRPRNVAVHPIMRLI